MLKKIMNNKGELRYKRPVLRNKFKIKARLNTICYVFLKQMIVCPFGVCRMYYAIN